ncbi:MAG: hypothetical protein IMZ52_10010 [Actinobacteria bacterium]|nr:hypothetical protein [Actinomycetota bacterium]MBE3122103.1 hypothetical protein [Thermoplasmata archaeon]
MAAGVEMWENFSKGIIPYAMSAFSGLEPWVYPLIFVGIIGYVYATVNSVIVAVVAIIITFGLYATTTDIFVNVPDLNLFFYIVVLIGLTLLITTLFIRRIKQ